MAQNGPRLRINERNTIWLQFKKGDISPCCSDRVKHNGTVSTDDFIKRLAERSGEEIYVIDSAGEKIAASIGNGENRYRECPYISKTMCKHLHHVL